MKYWNKDKKVRQQHWCSVKVATQSKEFSWHGSRTTVFFPDWPHARRDEMKRWCQLTPGGRFYNYYASDIWWFEFEQDAALFALKWL